MYLLNIDEKLLVSYTYLNLNCSFLELKRLLIAKIIFYYDVPNTFQTNEPCQNLQLKMEIGVELFFI